MADEGLMEPFLTVIAVAAVGAIAGAVMLFIGFLFIG